MKNSFVVGINHKTAPIEVRENFFLRSTEQDLLLSELKSNPSVIEAFVLSTCNRTEVYLRVLDAASPTEFVIKHLAKIKKITLTKEIRKCFYTKYEKEMLYHLLKVSTGLDSLVLGEKQIFGQVKSAFERAREHSMFQKNFNLLSNTAIRTGRKAQSETRISTGGSSVSWAAITMTEKTLGTLENKSVLIIGAGKMGEIALSHLKTKGIKDLFLMNRTEAIAKELAARFSGEAVSFCDMKETLEQVDVCICSTGAPHYVLEKGTVEKVVAKREDAPLLFMDISMPRNIDPAVAEVSGVQLFTIDDLDKVVERNMLKRKQAVADVEAIIETKLADYIKKITKPILVQETEPAETI